MLEYRKGLVRNCHRGTVGKFDCIVSPSSKYKNEQCDASTNKAFNKHRYLVYILLFLADIISITSFGFRKQYENTSNFEPEKREVQHGSLTRIKNSNKESTILTVLSSQSVTVIHFG